MLGPLVVGYPQTWDFVSRLCVCVCVGRGGRNWQENGFKLNLGKGTAHLNFSHNDEQQTL